MNITLRQLRALLAGIHSRSFSEAASRCYVSQPAYSLLIRQLEAQLGVKLFDRTTRRVEPTVTGRELGERIGQILADLDDSLREIADVVSGRRGRVTVGVMPTIGASILAATLAQLARDYPGVSICIREDQAAPLEELVAHRIVDFAVGVEMSDSQSVSFAPLLQEQMFGVFHPDEPLLASKAITWKRVAHLPYIAFARSSVQAVVSRGVGVAHVELQPAYEITYIATALNLVRAGLGFTIIPELGLRTANLENVIVRPVVQPKVFRTVGIMTNRHRVATPAAEAVIQALRTGVLRRANPA